ncbi:MAG TPA: carboxypeptidase regulatory-like domain-containing protein [Polyangiaceae bacterium]
MIAVALALVAALLVWRFLPGARPARSDSPKPGASADAAAPRATMARRPPRPIHLTGATTAVKNEAAALGHLSGKVTDMTTGKPIVGAELFFEGPGGGRSVRSDTEGGFRFDPSDEGMYLVTLITADGYLPFTADSGESPVTFVARRGKDIENVVFALENAAGRAPIAPPPPDAGAPGARIEGRVTDAATGRPIAAFSVVASEVSVARNIAGVVSVLDANGEFELGGLAPHRSYLVNAAARGYAVSSEVTVTTGAEDEPPASVEIALAAGATLSGSVLSADKSVPIAGARVSLESAIGRASSPVPLIQSTDTDARGEFSLAGIAPGRRSVIVAASGYHRNVVGGLEVPPEPGAALAPVVVRLSPLAQGEPQGVELVGIGLTLRPEETWLRVERVVPGGTAEQAGFVVGDHILAVEGVAVAEIGMDGAIQRIRGPEGTTVSLLIQRVNAAQPTVVVVPRRRVRGF